MVCDVFVTRDLKSNIFAFNLNSVHYGDKYRVFAACGYFGGSLKSWRHNFQSQSMHSLSTTISVHKKNIGPRPNLFC